MSSGAVIERMTIRADPDELYGELIRGPRWRDRETVVLCHGLGGNHASWFQQVPELVESYDILTWDQRGFGNSTNRAGLATPQQTVRDLRLLLSRSGIRRPHLVGQSLGGWAALGLAVAHPREVASVVLADSLGGMRTTSSVAALDAHISARAAAARRPAPVGTNAALHNGFGTREPTLAFLYQQLASFSSPPPDTLRCARETSVDVESVRRSGVPLLLVVGEDDRIVPPDAVREVASQLSHAAVVVLAGAGHSAHFERPEAFNAALLDHLRSVG